MPDTQKVTRMQEHATTFGQQRCTGRWGRWCWTVQCRRHMIFIALGAHTIERRMCIKAAPRPAQCGARRRRLRLHLTTTSSFTVHF